MAYYLRKYNINESKECNAFFRSNDIEINPDKIENELYIGRNVNFKIGGFAGTSYMYGTIYDDNNTMLGNGLFQASLMSKKTKNDWLKDNILSVGDILNVRIYKIKKNKSGRHYQIFLTDREMSDQMIEKQKNDLKDILSQPFDSAKNVTVIQNIPVVIKLSITDHAIIREKERLDIAWNDVFLNTDFIEKTLKGIITHGNNVNRHKKFMFYNSITNVTSVLYFDEITLTEQNVLYLHFVIVTLWKGLNDNEYYTLKGDSSSIAYKILSSDNKTYVAQTIVPIKFCVKGDNSNKHQIYQLKLTNWNNNSPLSVAGGCLRKTISCVFYDKILRRQGRSFYCYEPSGPIYVGYKYDGYDYDSDTFEFTLKTINHSSTFKNDYDIDIYEINNHYNTLKDISQHGNVINQIHHLDKKISYN